MRIVSGLEDRPPFASRPDSSPGFLLWRTTLRWQRAVAAALKPLGLTHVQFVLLASVWWLTEQARTPADLPSQAQVAAHAAVDVMMTSSAAHAKARGHGVADAALDGTLSAARLAALRPAEVVAALKSVRGIGDFYAQLIHVRALQGTDVMPTGEPRLLAAAAELVGHPLSPQELTEMAAGWSPFRGWAAFLLRAA